MSECQIKFKYQQQDIIIKCQKNETLKEIFNRFAEKTGLAIDEVFFLYNSNPILDIDQTVNQINDKDEEIIVLVHPKDDSTENNTIRTINKTKESNYIKCVNCENPAIVVFTHDYKINLIDGKHNIKNIKLKNYFNTQKIDESKIECCKCQKSMSETHQSFYYCFECQNNFCSTCLSNHDEHTNIVDYQVKTFRCQYHKDQNLTSYCMHCKKNMCLFCISDGQHTNHNIINFINLIQKQNNSKGYYIDKIKKVKKITDDIINILYKFNENLDVYIKINSKLDENLAKMNMNYEILKTRQNLMKASFLKKDFDFIINNSDIIERMKKIMFIYEIMNGDSFYVRGLSTKTPTLEQKTHGFFHRQEDDIGQTLPIVTKQQQIVNKNIRPIITREIEPGFHKKTHSITVTIQPFIHKKNRPMNDIRIEPVARNEKHSIIKLEIQSPHHKKIQGTALQEAQPLIAQKIQPIRKKKAQNVIHKQKHSCISQELQHVLLSQNIPSIMHEIQPVTRKEFKPLIQEIQPVIRKKIHPIVNGKVKRRDKDTNTNRRNDFKNSAEFSTVQSNLRYNNINTTKSNKSDFDAKFSFP